MEGRAVERVGAGGAVQRVAERDLVADDEHRLPVTLEQLAESAHVPERGRVEALAARERALAAELALYAAVLVEVAALELAHVDVVEEQLRLERNLPALERDPGRFRRPREARVDAGVERDVRHLVAQPVRLLPPLLRQRDVDGRVAVDAPLHVEDGVRVPCDDEEPHSGY